MHRNAIGLPSALAGFSLILFAEAILPQPTCGAETASAAAVAYPAYRFEDAEGWHARAAGNAGASGLKGKTWSLDFSQGARWLALAPPDRSLLGRPMKFRIRVRGSAKGHPVHLSLRTHFMTFHKAIGEFTGSGEQELVVEAPPGPGWQWSGGENDGKLHGPLRVGEIRLEANGQADRASLELLEIAVEATCPTDRQCVLVAESTAEGRRAGFSARIRALADARLEGILHWQLRDWDGKDRGRGQRAVSIPARAEAVAVDAPPTEVPAGLRFLEAEFSLEVPGQKIPAAYAYWLAPLEVKMKAEREPDSPMGMGLYLNRLSGATMERSAAMGREAGVKWSREDFSWARIEPEKGRFDWSYYDGLLDCAKRNGITVYAIVGYWSAWTKPYTEEGIDDYVRFLRELVKRYHKDIKQWEIWNEPNIFFWQGPKELYATLLTKSYAAVKDVDPTAQVLGISTAGIDYRFIEDMLARKAPFDILTIHPYRRELDDAAFIADLKKASDLVKLPDGRRRPVWLTEMGWATHVPHHALNQDFAPASPRHQAELLARTYLCSVVSGVEPRTFWYDFRNDGDDPIYFEHNLGVVTHDFRPKPAYPVYAVLAQAISSRKLEGPVPVADGVLAYRFVPKVGAGSMLAVWSPKKDVEIQLPVRATPAVRINAIGEVEPLEPLAGSKPPSAIVRLKLRRGVPEYVSEP